MSTGQFTPEQLTQLNALFQAELNTRLEQQAARFEQQAAEQRTTIETQVAKQVRNLQETNPTQQAAAAGLEARVPAQQVTGAWLEAHVAALSE